MRNITCYFYEGSSAIEIKPKLIKMVVFKAGFLCMISSLVKAEDDCLSCHLDKSDVLFKQHKLHHNYCIGKYTRRATMLSAEQHK